MKTKLVRGALPTMTLLVALSGLYGCGGDPAPPPATAATTAPAGAAPTAAAPAGASEDAAPSTAATAPQTVPGLLEAANKAMREQRYILPEGDNAIEYYLAALDLEPENRQAQLAILELMPSAQGVTERLIDTNRLDEAAVAVAVLKRAQPTSVVVTTLEQRIVAQRRAAEQRLQAEEAAARLAEQRAREAQVAAAPATAPAPARPQPPATTPAAAADPEPAAPATPAPAQPAATLASAAPAPSVAASTAPENQDFKLIRRVNAAYPAQALRSRTEGWVELAFTITVDGDVTDVEVIDANPRRIFDREAARALGQWKFTPRIENGKAVSARARQRLEFNLN
jgi:periplasmic protein TonB